MIWNPRLKSLLMDGINNLQSSTEEDGDFRTECQCRVQAGLAWLGQKLVEHKPVDLETETCEHKNLQDILEKMTFPIVAKSDMLPLSKLQEKMNGLKICTTAESVESLSKSIDTEKELVNEMTSSIKVAVNDLKKSKTRREKDRKREEDEKKKKREQEQKKEEMEAAEEHKRSLLLANLAVSFNLDKSLFVTYLHSQSTHTYLHMVLFQFQFSISKLNILCTGNTEIDGTHQHNCRYVIWTPDTHICQYSITCHAVNYSKTYYGWVSQKVKDSFVEYVCRVLV